MLWFLIRTAAIAFILYCLYVYVTDKSHAVQRHFAWMHPEMKV